MNRSLFFCAFVAVAATSFAYDWPAPDVKVRKSFGQKVAGSYIPGIEVDTMTSQLTAPEKGDVLFVFQGDSTSVQNLPSGLGGFVALAHEDNLRTLITNVSPSKSLKSTVSTGDPLGSAVLGTQSDVTRHRLFVFDQQLSELVNPLLVFPPLDDARSPVIIDVKAEGEGTSGSSSLFSRSTFPVGYWTLYVEASDPTNLGFGNSTRGSDVQKGVYSLEAYLNGTEVFVVNLNSIHEKGGKWLIKGKTKPLGETLVQDRVWNLGQVFFNQGTNILELVVKDYQGNESGRTFRIQGIRS